jgi:hypothetical protein
MGPKRAAMDSTSLGRAAVWNVIVSLLMILAGSTVPASARASPRYAEEIMGGNCLGVDAVQQAFGVRLTEQEQKKIERVPFSESTLRERRNSHILLLGIARDASGQPLTIQRLREMFPAGGQPRFRSYPRPGEIRDAYATTETPDLRWYLIARNLRRDSRSKPYWQQEQFLKANEYRERAVVYVYMMFLVYKARGERLFPDDLVWCKSAGSDGAPVAAGYFRSEGLYVSDWWLRPDEHFGMAPARKADSPPAP